MTQAVAKYAAKKMLSKQMKEYKNKEPAGPYDPYYEYRPDPRNPNKTKKMKKQIPAYIPSHDADVLANVRKAAYRLDCSLFTFMGVRFGVSSVIGLIPELGDVIDGGLAMNVVRKCNKIEGGLPKAVLMNMLLWVLIDFFIGLVPFVGDLLDASVKANTKNCRLLEQHLDKKYKPKTAIDEEKRRRDDARKSRIPYDEPAPATVYEDLSDDDNTLPQYSERPADRHTTTAAGGAGMSTPARPAATVAPEDRRDRTRTQEPKPSRSFFGYGSKR